MGCYSKSPHVGSYFFHHSISVPEQLCMLVRCRREVWFISFGQWATQVKQLGIKLLILTKNSWFLYVFLVVQLNKCETGPYFLQYFQCTTMFISVFCKSCKTICKPEITPVLYHLKNLQKSRQKQFHVQCSVYKWTSLCIGNFEEDIDLSRIFLAVQM